MPDSTDTRTYEIVFAGGTIRITVPGNARVTYAPVVSPAGGKAYGGNALRFWLGTKESGTQLALFNDVTSFRDVSLPIQVRGVRLFGATDWWRDDGSWTGPRADLVEQAWVDIETLVSQPAEPHSLSADLDEVFNVPLTKPRANRTITITKET